MPVMRACKNCGITYPAYYHGTVFCSKACRADYKANHKCPGPSRENCLNCKFDDCIAYAGTAPTLEETNDINAALGREEWRGND